jgi:phosphoglycolate phosphatase-like HAD superfamily hydrolase
MRDFGYTANQLCYLGDRGSDLATAKAAATHGVGVHTGLDDLAVELRQLGLENTYPVFSSLSDAIDYLLNEL